MTIEQKIPQAVPIAQGQVVNGIAAINNRDNRIESAAFGYVVLPVNANIFGVTSAKYWEGSYLQLTVGTPAPTGIVQLQVPAEERGMFTVWNNCGQSVKVEIAGQPVTGPTVAVGDIGTFVSDGINVRTAMGSSSSTPVVVVPFRMTIAVTDEITDITTGTGVLTFRMSDAVDLTEVRASVRTASASGAITINVKESGTSIFSTLLTIDATEKTSTTAAVPAVISDGVIADDAEITVDIVAAGGSADGLKITFIGTYT